MLVIYVKKCVILSNGNVENDKGYHSNLHVHLSNGKSTHIECNEGAILVYDQYSMLCTNVSLMHCYLSTMESRNLGI